MPPVLNRDVLATMPHRELVQVLTHLPHNRLVQNEFIARYEPYIRQTVLQSVYAVGYGTKMRDMVDDVVNEIFYRLFRNDCRVLLGAEMQYDSSIFAYLRSMCQNMVRNYVRDYFSHEPIAQSSTTSWKEEANPQTLIEQIPAENETSPFDELPEVCNHVAEVWQKQAAFAQNMDRNLIIFKLHFIHGYHYDEIARIKGLGLGESGVGNTIARLKHRLQNDAMSRKRLLH